MAHGATVEQNGKLTEELTLPDFANYPEMYGWPLSNERGYRIEEQLCGYERPMRIVAVGGGVSGMNLAKVVRDELQNVSVTIYEKNAELGGTWYENRYPGIACDIPSHSYQFNWAKNPEWKEFYSSGAEIQRYLMDVVAQHDLRKFFHVSHQVIGATWDDERGIWEIKVKNLTSGEVFKDEADIFVNNEGLLNNWRWPKIEGLWDFKGVLTHSANYDPDMDLSGKRVAVMGIGSTGIQVIPAIASKVEELYAFIRSPTWVTPGFAQKYSGPGGTNFNYTPEQMAEFRANPAKYQELIKGIENELNVRFRYILNGTPEAKQAVDFSVQSMKSKLGERTDISDAIIPTTFGLGCRRPTPGTGFLEALTLPHVTTFSNAMRKITEKGFVDPEGIEHEVDIIICATGFDTSWVPRFPIHYNGHNLQEDRKKEALSYISLGAPDVPNYFAICGPYGPFAHGSYTTVSEMLVRNLVKVTKKMQKERIKSVAPKREVCEAFAEHADLFAKRTAWNGPCSSWFKNGDVNGRLTVFPGSRLTYFDLLWEPRYEDYKIEYMGGNEFQYLGNGFHACEFNGGDNSYYLGTIDGPVELIAKERPSESVVL